jgi:hypothetical protein
MGIIDGLASNTYISNDSITILNISKKALINELDKSIFLGK